MHWEASQGEGMESWELSRPAQARAVGKESVVPQEVELTARPLQAGLAVETPEWRHEEGEQRGSGGLQVSRVLRSTGRAGGGGVGGGGRRGFLQVRC